MESEPFQFMPATYWPWWLGGAALASVALLFPLLNGETLGVSGALSQLFTWPWKKSVSGEAGPATKGCGDGSVRPPSEESEAASRADWIGNLAFLLAIAVGGAIGGKVGGVPWGQTALSPEFHRLFGRGALALAVLFGGGILVGFGTRWSGGCTSGHGLSGCGRLQPASLAATAVFFGIAIIFSFLLERILS